MTVLDHAFRAAAPDPRLRGASVVAVVAHARSVRSLEREALIASLEALEPGPGLITIHTCHRAEAYLSPVSFRGSLPELPAGTVVLRDADAARHFISVACGLESAVAGETQILHQLREAYAVRRADAALDPVLDRLFQAALHAGRAARSWFSGSPRSLADVALDRIEPSGSLDGRTILVVGVGKMGRLAAFATRRRGGSVVIANRSDARARALAAEVDAVTVPFGVDGSVAALPKIDGAVVAIGGEWPVGARDVERLVQDGVTVVDLSSPPAVPAALAAALGPRSISVDDLAVVEALPDPRLRRRLDRLVFDAGRSYCDWIRARDAVPAIHGVVDAMERVRGAEVEWLRSRMSELSEDDFRTVEQMSHRLVAAILHAPLTALNDDASGELAVAARELFGL